MKLGAYEAQGELGRGGMGVVYRALAPDASTVAIKLLGTLSRHAFERFEREARLLGTLGAEEGFVPLLGRGDSPFGPFLVMPLLEGGTLEDRLKRGTLDVEEARALGERLARALGRAHALGIVHRDLKPANVLFDAKGRAFLADMGLAKHFRRDLPGGGESRSLTHAGAGSGTIGYMAPEQIGDAKVAGPPADVFSLGAILYECLSGQLPYGEESLIAFATRLESGELPPLAGLRKDVPRRLASAIERALARAPEDRFQDGAAFAKALREMSGETAARPRSRLPFVALASLIVLALAGGALYVGSAGEDASSRVPAGTSTPAPPSPQALALVESGKRKQERRDPDGAIADFTRAIALEPRQASAFALRGSAYGDKCDWPRAFADFDHAIELEPGSALAWKERGVAHANKQEWDPAIADLTKAIELDPKFASAWQNRGASRSHKGDREGAIQDSTRAIELDPRSALAWHDRGVIRATKGDLEGGLADLKRALELGPELASVWESRSGLRVSTGDYDGAIQDSTRAIELDPKRFMAWANRGRARGRKGDWPTAIDDLTKALELEPGLSVLWHDRGVSRANSGDWQGALADCTRAIELDPKPGIFWFSRAQALSKTGQRDAAIADVKRAIELSGSEAWADSARKLLAKLESEAP